MIIVNRRESDLNQEHMLSKYRIIEMHIGQHMVWIPIITVRLFEQDIDYY